MQSLVEARPQNGVGADNVDGLEARKPRQQIEVCRKQTGGVRNPVGNRDDEVPKGLPRRLAYQMLAQKVFVARAALENATLVPAKRAREEAGLRQQLLEAAVVPIGASKRVRHEFFKSVDPLRLSTQLVVEAHHLGDEAGANLERQRLKTVSGRDRCRLCDRVALDG